MARDRSEVLRSSSDADELVMAALSFARGPSPEGHAVLQERLQTQDFLAKLDSEEEYRDTGSTLRVGRVLEALSENKAPSAHDVLVTLTKSAAFKSKVLRVDLLIDACAEVRPAPKEVVKFWDEHSQPRSGYTVRTVGAIVRNGTEPALALLEKKMADPEHTDDHKINWMRSRMLPYRNDLPLLESCERILKGKMPESLRPRLVEVLFDWRPEEWYGEHKVKTPPPREEMTAQARLKLLEIGEYALEEVELDDRQKHAVETTLDQLRDRSE